MGRAGRPQFDDSGVAHILVQDTKKSFFKRFLHEPFPVESSLNDPQYLHDHINAEIVGGSIRSRQSAVEYLTWTYFYRRLWVNPTYYGLIPEALRERMGEDEEEEEERMFGSDGAADLPGPKATVAGQVYISERDVNTHLSGMVETALQELEASGCVDTDESSVEPTQLGKIASFYYLQHGTVRLFKDRLREDMGHAALLILLSDAKEYDELPVR